VIATPLFYQVPCQTPYAHTCSKRALKTSGTLLKRPVPGPGGTSLHFLTFPPASVFSDPSFDGEAARDEALIRLRGLADYFEKEDPAMHKTNTVDYAVVYDGEIWLELDNGETVHLNRGDVVVQSGTRHAWRNKGARPVTMLFFLNGATV
jgi:mannose-6-phosphate isomerase-like protein (cupin superfamily)